MGIWKPGENIESLTDDEKRLVEAWRRMREDYRDAAMTAVESLAVLQTPSQYPPHRAPYSMTINMLEESVEFGRTPRA